MGGGGGGGGGLWGISNLNFMSAFQVISVLLNLPGYCFFTVIQRGWGYVRHCPISERNTMHL